MKHHKKQRRHTTQTRAPNPVSVITAPREGVALWVHGVEFGRKGGGQHMHNQAKEEEKHGSLGTRSKNKKKGEGTVTTRHGDKRRKHVQFGRDKCGALNNKAVGK